jgi:hypothetical protein
MAAIAVTPALVGFSSTAEAFNPYLGGCGNTYPPQPCGEIIYANAGGYSVRPTEIFGCSDSSSYKYENDIDLGQHITFGLPASCKYELKINIVGGSKKSRTWLLTPGCKITAKTDGTTYTNKWHVGFSWINEEMKNQLFPNGDAPDHPADPAGNQCG